MQQNDPRLSKTDTFDVPKRFRRFRFRDGRSCSARAPRLSA